MSELERFVEYLILHRAPNLPVDGLAEVLDRLIWCLDDNGRELLAIRDKWLQGDNKEKVEIALSMQEVFPAEGRGSMVELFDMLSAKWPSVRPLCEEWLKAWDKQHSPKP